MMTTRRIPKRLNVEPLIEALWEIRFSSEGGAPVGDVLPAMIHQAMGGDYPNWVRLAAADIPRPIADKDEALRYVPTVRLESADGGFAVQVGQRVVTLNCRRPYPGWGAFSGRIRALAEFLRASGLIRQPDRFSLKYIDLIELDPAPSLASLKAKLEIGGISLDAKPVQLRTEIEEPPFAHVVQLATPVTATLSGGETRLQGALVDIDTICAGAAQFWDTMNERLDQAHEASKRIFFGLLTDAAIERMQPEYEQAEQEGAAA